MSTVTSNMKEIIDSADRLVKIGERLLSDAGNYEQWKHEFLRPEGYQFKDENGNVINATKIVLEKKKPKYPTTYEECCKVLDLLEMMLPRAAGWNCYKINALQKLLICRDAYWKLAGEEMGLGKPWEPDWNNHNIKYILFNQQGEIDCTKVSGPRNYILAFPTEEMRNAFYENFKKLINEVKELL